MKATIHTQSTTVFFAGVGVNEKEQLRRMPEAYTLLKWALRPYYNDENTDIKDKRSVKAKLRVDVNGMPMEIIYQDWLLNTDIEPDLNNSAYAIQVASDAFGCDTKEDVTDYMSADENTESFGVFEVKLTLEILT